MGCSGCSTRSVGLPAGCKNNGSCATGGCGSKLDVYDWLSNIYTSEQIPQQPVVEVKFKGTRKEYYRNAFDIPLEIGDAVVVESQTTGWDIGYVSLTGELIRLQLKKYKIDPDSEQMKRVLRIANEQDMEKYEEGKSLEFETMIRTRKIAGDLGLVMKVSDVEYQGDRTKATFFYTAEGRVDFRELIKILAREFRIKVEMRQIGLRQEAGRLGGIGSCGRELCCSTWLTDFHSVPTTAARYQNLFLNPLKLSGQCGRLKCCLNYELDVYVEALNDFPEENTRLRTEKGIARVEKMDILKRIMWFRYEGDDTGKFYPLEIEEVKRIIDLNEQGILPTDLEEYQAETEMVVKEVEFKDVVGEERLDRFDRQKRGKKRNNNRGGRQQAEGQGQRSQGERRQDRRPDQQRGQGNQQPRGENGPRQNNNNPQQRNQGERQQRPEGQRQENRPQRQNEGPPRQNNNQQPRVEGQQRRDNRGPRPEGGQPSREDRQPRENRPPRENNGQPRNNTEGQPRQENRPPRNNAEGQSGPEGAKQRPPRQNKPGNNRNNNERRPKQDNRGEDNNNQSQNSQE